MSYRLLNVAFLAVTVLATSVRGQTAGSDYPKVEATGRGEVEVVPDRAELVVYVETRAAEGSRAGEQNARLTQQVIDTLRRGFGLGARDVSTIGYSLSPQMVYPGDGQPPRLTGYVARNTIRVRTDQMDRIGAMIDASLARGASGVNGPSFYLSDREGARREALTRAVTAARRDAEAMAGAAGGRLGPLIEIIAEPGGGEPPMPRYAAMEMRAQAVADTPIELGTQKVTATVVVRWRFVRN